MSEIIAAMALGAVIGMVIFYYAMKIAVSMLHSRLENDLKEIEHAIRDSVDLIPCRVEQHDGVFFVYNNDTNEFMAQGSTLDELRERIKARWKDQRVSVVAGDEAVLEQLKAQLNESSSSK